MSRKNANAPIPSGALGEMAFWGRSQFLLATNPTFSLAQFRAEIALKSPYVLVTDATGGGLYRLDSTDTTSADDGLNCLINADTGGRYKRMMPWTSLTQAQRDAIPSPTDGLMGYQTDNTPGFWARISGVFHRFVTVSAGGIAAIVGILSLTNSDNPTDGVLATLSNTKSGGSTGGARLRFHQRDVGEWVIGILGAASHFIVKGWNGVDAVVERLRIQADGKMGIGTDVPTSRLHVKEANGYNQFRLETSYTPTGTNDANGAVGDICWDANYFYVKTSGGWKRSPLSSW